MDLATWASNRVLRYSWFQRVNYFGRSTPSSATWLSSTRYWVYSGTRYLSSWATTAKLLGNMTAESENLADTLPDMTSRFGTKSRLYWERVRQIWDSAQSSK